ncbi:MAG: 6-bladed beta-propeller [Gemmatimonadota bacterium]
MILASNDLRLAFRCWAAIGAAACIVSVPLAAAQAPGREEGHAVASEQLRVSGAADTEPFGRIDCIAATPDGGVALFDGKGMDGPTLLLLDENGKLRRRLGRKGAGPGEYSSLQLSDCISVTADGTIVLLDRGLSRIVRWDRNGKLLPAVSVPVRPSGLPPYLVPLRDGSFYVHSVIRPPTPGGVFDGGDYGYIHLSAAGSILDTLRPSAMALRKRGHRIGDPNVQWFPRIDGSVLEADQAELGYRLRDLKGAWHPVSHPRPAIPFSTAELAEEAAIQEWTRLLTRGAVPAGELAETKPAFERIFSDAGMRVWLLRRVPAEAGIPRPEGGPPSIGATPRPARHLFEPPVWVRFSAKGKYEGEVRFPLESASGSAFVATGNTVWSASLSKEGEPVVIKWLIEMH